MKKAYSIHVKGRVQNVGYRYNALQRANELSISGIIRNRSDGTVYIEAEGEAENLEQFIAWCQHGPDWAHVDDLNIEEYPVSGFKDFTIR